MFALYTVVLFVGMAAAGVGYGASPTLNFLFVLWGVFSCAVAGLNIFMHFWVVPREVRSGYTTGYRIHKEVDYVDPDSGHIPRLAGEEFLKPEERRRREAAVKELIAREVR